jgi:hypothetical protein
MGSGCVTVGILPMADWLGQSVAGAEEYTFPTVTAKDFHGKCKVFGGPTENAGRNVWGCLPPRAARWFGPAFSY